MAISKRQQQELLNALLSVHEPVIRKAFLEAVAAARDSVDLAAVTAALARGDLAGAMEAVQVSRTFLAPMDMAFHNAYFNSGRRIFDQLVADGRRSGVTVQVRFDAGDPRAADWLRQHSAALIGGIVEEQREAVREAAARGMAAGRHPRSVALDIAGRVNRATGLREGGVIGLTGQQAQWLANAREELRSGDRAYFKRKLRNRTHDRTVARAIREGRALTAAEVDRISTAYSERLLKYRAETIARTEGLTALSHGQDESAQQLMQATGLREDQITRTWLAHIDSRTRDGHIALHDKKAPLGAAFVSPETGARMRFPRDTSLGASGVDVINCRCTSSLKVTWNKPTPASPYWARIDEAPNGL